MIYNFKKNCALDKGSLSIERVKVTCLAWDASLRCLCSTWSVWSSSLSPTVPPSHSPTHVTHASCCKEGLLILITQASQLTSKAHCLCRCGLSIYQQNMHEIPNNTVVMSLTSQSWYEWISISIWNWLAFGFPLILVFQQYFSLT